MKYKIYSLFIILAVWILSKSSLIYAQAEGDSLDMLKLTMAYSTPRGVAVVAQLHIAHPETTHASQFRGYYIYRKEIPKEYKYASQQEADAAFAKIKAKRPDLTVEQAVKEVFAKLPYRRLNKTPIAAPTNSQNLVEALGLELYQRILNEKDLGGGDINILMNKLKAGNENLAIIGGMMIPRLGEALGMIYYDTDVKKGETYYYVATKVREDFSEGDTTMMGGVVYGEVNKPIIPSELKSLVLKEKPNTDTSADTGKNDEKLKTEPKKEASDIKDVKNLLDTTGTKVQQIKIANKPTNNMVIVKAQPKQLGPYYYVLRGTDSLDVFTPIHSLPFMAGNDSSQNITQLVLEDTTVISTMTYYYTVATEDIWGNRVYSDTSAITILPTLPPIPQELKAETSKDGVKLDWEALDYEYLSGYNLYKKINEEPDTIIGEKINKQLLPANVTTFIETKVKPGATYYYFLATVDKFGQESKYSAMAKITYENKRPPLPPLNLSAVANPTTKSVTISWSIGEEEDLAGYAIYRSQNAKDEPSLITKQLLVPTATSYIDTTRIGKNVDYYYYIRSMNLTGYESPLSQYVVSRVQEKIKPERVNSLSGEADLLQGNKLTWDAPLDANVETIRLFRMTAPDLVNRTLLYEERVSNGKFMFRDKNIEAGVQYYYILRGISADSLESDDSAPTTLFLTPEKLQAPDRLSIAPQADGSLLLKWIPNFQDGLAGFHVYRISYKGGKKRLTSTPILKGTNTYLDKDIQKDEIYHYFVRSVDSKGFEGFDSEQVKFEMIIAEK